MENIWITRNGTKINVRDMTTQHILNTLKCIEERRIIFLMDLGYLEDNDCKIIDENDIEKEHWIKIFKEELKRRKVI